MYERRTMEEHNYASDRGAVRYWLTTTASNDPWLVFLPGLTCEHHLFDFQIEHFRGLCNTLVWDAPAHGESRPYAADFTLSEVAELLFAILQREGITNPILVGHSFGAFVAQMLIDLHPGCAGGFACIDSMPLQRKYYSKFDLAFLKHTYWMYRCIPWKQLVSWGAKGTAASPEGRRNVKEAMLSYQPEEFRRLIAHGFAAIAEAIEQDCTVTIDCPAVLLAGEKDPVGYVRTWAPTWAENIGAEVYTVPQASHNACIDNPAFVNNIIESTFLNR